MSKKSLTFAERRERLEAIASDAEVIATDLARYATALFESVRVLSEEAESMKRAEERFAERAKTKKATS